MVAITCPGWVLQYINTFSCEIKPTKDGKFRIIDDSLKYEIAIGDSKRECQDWIMEQEKK